MYQKTLLGVILNISCLLKTPGVVENHGYFLNPSRSSPQEIKVQEANIHQVELSPSPLILDEVAFPREADADKAA